MRIHILHNPKILRFDCLTVRFLCNKNLTERGILLSRYLIFFSLSSPTCSRIVRTARVIFGSHVFLFFSFLFFLTRPRLRRRLPLYVANSPLSFIAHRAQRATHAAAPGLILYPGIKVLITLGLITLGSKLRRVILYGRINCRLR